MIRSIRLLVFASVLTMAHGVLAEERIGIRSHSLGWLRGLDNAHVLVLKITEHGKTCGMTKNIAEKEFVSGIRAIPATTYKEGDEVDNIFVLSINTIYRKEIGWCTSNLAVNFFTTVLSTMRVWMKSSRVPYNYGLAKLYSTVYVKTMPIP